MNGNAKDFVAVFDQAVSIAVQLL